jgi:hypothetical protein
VGRRHTGETWSQWSKVYEHKIFEALGAVLTEWGVEAWRSVRWEVYDKVRTSRLRNGTAR